jgi:hypothetical protein
MTRKWLRWLITVGAVGIAVVHLVCPSATIDGVTATLLLVALLPWLQPLFKSLELPGGVKVEFQDLEKVAARADAAGLLSTPLPADQKEPYSFQMIATADPNLALAGLRIELERRLVQLAKSRGHEDAPKSIGQLLHYLNSKQLINGSERSVLSDLVPLLNSAVHGARVDAEAVDWALDTGPRILGALDERAASSEIRYRGIVPDE